MKRYKRALTATRNVATANYISAGDAHPKIGAVNETKP